MHDTDRNDRPGSNTRWRSMMFTPANRSDLVAKFGRVPAGAFVLDLEDGTPEPERPAARAALAQTVAAARATGTPASILIRVNPVGSRELEDDLRAAAGAAPDGIVIAKVDGPQDVLGVRAAWIGQAPMIVAGIESVRGVVEIPRIAASGVSAVYFGAEDFSVDLGARRTREGDEVLYARSRVVLHARAAGVAAIDQVVLDIRDDQLFAADAERGRSLGYRGKMCLLPRQVELANRAFAPSPDEVARARRLIAAYDRAVAAGRGTIDFEGRMVDVPLLRVAEAIVADSEPHAE